MTHDKPQGRSRTVEYVVLAVLLVVPLAVVRPLSLLYLLWLALVLGVYVLVRRITRRA